MDMSCIKNLGVSWKSSTSTEITVNGGGGVLVEFQGEFVLMNFELLTFPHREIIKLSIHVYKMNQFIYRKRIFCVMLALFI